MDVPRDASAPGDGDNQLYAEIRDQAQDQLSHAATGHTPPEYEDVAPKLSSDYKVTQCAAYGVHAQ